MRCRFLLPLCLALASCGGPLGDAGPGGDAGVAAVPPGAFGDGDQDIAAANLAQYDFADTGRVYGKPGDAARAAAAVEYLAGELNNGTRWPALSADTKQQLLDSRIAVRHALGLAPDARSQAVVNALLATAAAINSGDEATIRAALSAPAFTLLPAQTLDRLDDLPYMQPVNLATDRAASEMASVTEGACRDCTQFQAPR